MRHGPSQLLHGFNEDLFPSPFSVPGFAFLGSVLLTLSVATGEMAVVAPGFTPPGFIHIEITVSSFRRGGHSFPETLPSSLRSPALNNSNQDIPGTQNMKSRLFDVAYTTQSSPI